MTELSLVPKQAKYSPEFMNDFYAQLIGHAQEKGHKPGSAYHQYIKKFKVEPPELQPAAKAPTPEVLGWIKSRQIAFAKMRKAA